MKYSTDKTWGRGNTLEKCEDLWFCHKSNMSPKSHHITSSGPSLHGRDERGGGAHAPSGLSWHSDSKVQRGLRSITQLWWPGSPSAVRTMSIFTKFPGFWLVWLNHPRNWDHTQNASWREALCPPVSGRATLLTTTPHVGRIRESHLQVSKIKIQWQVQQGRKN